MCSGFVVGTVTNKTRYSELRDNEKFHFSHPLSAVDSRDVYGLCEDCYRVEMDCDSHKIAH